VTLTVAIRNSYRYFKMIHVMSVAAVFSQSPETLLIMLQVDLIIVI
jgi:hypothetical protein